MWWIPSETIIVGITGQQPYVLCLQTRRRSLRMPIIVQHNTNQHTGKRVQACQKTTEAVSLQLASPTFDVTQQLFSVLDTTTHAESPAEYPCRDTQLLRSGQK